MSYIKSDKVSHRLHTMPNGRHEKIPDILSERLRRMGQDIAAARKVRRMSQSDLAERVGVARITIVRLESGDARVNLGALARTAWVMGLDDGLTGAFSPDRDPVFQRESRLDLPKRVRAPSGDSETEDLDF